MPLCRCGDDCAYCEQSVGMWPMEHWGAWLTANGYCRRIITHPEKALEPRCKTCRDAGWVSGNRPLTDPMFGKAVRCPDCVTASRRTWGVPEDFEGMRFEDWNKTLNPTMDEAFAAARSFGRGDLQMLALFGDWGVGKTLLSCMILSERPGAFWRWVDLLIHMRGQMFEKGVDLTEEQVIVPYMTMPDVLVLDDVGVQNDTKWARQALHAILEARLSRRLPTVITGNELSDLGERLNSRLFKYTIVCEGDDVRRM